MIGGAVPVYVDGVPMRTESLSSVTGREWWLWRFGGKWGRKVIIRMWAKYFRMTPEKLAEFPTAIRFPDGRAYRVTSGEGDHQPLF